MNLSSANKRILILADPHQDAEKMERIIKAEAADEVVCLGDWFDSLFCNSRSHIEQTCNLLARFVCAPNRHTLWGNHDLHYFYPSGHSICSGYNKKNEAQINSCLGASKNVIADKFKWYIKIDDFLCTHAGLSPHHISPLLDVKDVDSFLNREGEMASVKLKTGQYHWFYAAGQARNGRLKKGGIVWLDFDDEFEAVDGLKQIVGHTYSKAIHPPDEDRGLNPNDWNDICIDCNLNQYLIIHNKKIEVKNYIDLP